MTFEETVEDAVVWLTIWGVVIVALGVVLGHAVLGLVKSIARTAMRWVRTGELRAADSVWRGRRKEP